MNTTKKCARELMVAADPASVMRSQIEVAVDTDFARIMTVARLRSEDDATAVDTLDEVSIVQIPSVTRTFRGGVRPLPGGAVSSRCRVVSVLAACAAAAAVAGTVVWLRDAGGPSRPVAPGVTTSPTYTPSTPPATRAAPLPATVIPRSASFPSPTVGFMTASSLDVRPTLWATTDAAHTWRALALPQGQTSIPTVTFADAHNGWLLYPASSTPSRLYATHDGARTWRLVDVANPVQVAAPASGGVEVTACTKTCELYLGSVGDDSVDPWQRVPGGNMSHFGEVGFFWGAFPNGGPSSVLIIKSRSTVLRALPCGAGSVPVFAPLSRDSYLTICGAASGGGAQQKKAYRSDDTGQTWQPIGEPPVSGYAQRAVVTSAGIILTGGRMGLDLSTDGGHTWPVTTFPGGGAWGELGPMWFTNPSHGFVYVGGESDSHPVLYSTADGGTTWHQGG